ncbi:hypothetical protein [Sphingomonas immobilis]|uniref:DUF11 domain-containing protein n=1 Tax=Sphingomonas immobilis TaxID=3063997 RepID=A0ABT8ZUR6_9SPHN|nr:hypothetical protein [Sphingomonas sp. CA1-15]MDO7841313.1 hypothetical protein [Sphingomonas sp. CA1-15]
MAACLCLFAAPAVAATQAGTSIVNIATLNWNQDGQPKTIPSNTATLVTAETLDVTITADRAAASAPTGTTTAVGFLVINTGNGSEDFNFGVTADQSGVAVSRLAIDSDNDGVYDAAKDRTLAPGTALSLTAGQQVRVFVLIDGTQVTAGTTISATVTAKTGSGAPGTVFAGAGDNGSDAVVGQTHATATAATILSPAAAQPSLVKSQSVFAPDGSARAMRGAIVTYTLAATFPGATANVSIDDPIPAGTAYVPGSLTLDQRALSDGADTDAGAADTSGIHVALGNVAAAGSHTIQFSVKIQ